MLKWGEFLTVNFLDLETFCHMGFTLQTGPLRLTIPKQSWVLGHLYATEMLLWCTIVVSFKKQHVDVCFPMTSTAAFGPKVDLCAPTEGTGGDSAPGLGWF